MAPVSGKLLPVGTRYVNFWALNTNGRPLAASSSVSYTGAQGEGGKGLTITVPEPRKISHSGDDRLLAVDILPPLEASSGELKIAKSLMALQALLSGVLASTIGESVGMLHATDQQGFEPQLGLLVYQQALDASGTAGIAGARRWRGLWFPKVKAIIAPKGTDDNSAEVTYRLTMFITGAHLWGPVYAASPDGATQSQFEERMYEGQPCMDSWIGDNATAIFTLTHPALSTAKVSVFVNGLLRTTNQTITVNSVTFTSVIPTTGQDINILYEW